jgi:hypothetical protein
VEGGDTGVAETVALIGQFPTTWNDQIPNFEPARRLPEFEEIASSETPPPLKSPRATSSGPDFGPSGSTGVARTFGASKAPTPHQMARPTRHCIESTVPRCEKLIPRAAPRRSARVRSLLRATPHRMSFSRNVFCNQVAIGRAIGTHCAAG